MTHCVQVGLTSQCVEVCLMTHCVQVGLTSQCVEVCLMTHCVQVGLTSQCVQVCLITHCVQVGLMRAGRMLEEDKPSALMDRYNMLVTVLQEHTA